MPVGRGIAKALESIGTSMPGLIDIYAKAMDISDKEKAKSGAKKILDEFEPEYPPLKDPMETTGSPHQQVLSATQQIAGPEPTVQEEQISGKSNKVNFDTWFNATGHVEGADDFQAVGPKLGEGSSSKGWSALGKWQIMPNLHFKKYGLDPNNPYDQSRFLDDSELQTSISRKVYREFWDKARKKLGPSANSLEIAREATKYAYGRGDDKAVPKAGGKIMPTGSEHWGKIKKQLGITDSDVRDFEVQGALSDAMNSLIGQKPTKPGRKPNIAQQKLEYFYSKASPEEVAAAAPMLEGLQRMSTTQRRAFETDMNNYQREVDRWASSVIAAERMKFGINKKLLSSKGKTSLNSDERQRLSLLRQSLQRRKSDLQNALKQYSKAGSSQRAHLEKSFPKLFKKKKREFGWLPFIPDFETQIDNMPIEALDKQLEAIEQALIYDTGLPIPSSPTDTFAAGTPLDLENYKVKRE